MLFLLGAVGCTSLVNIVLALASRRGWDGRAVLGWNYLASAAAAGLLAALARPALYFPAPGLLAGALSGGMTGPSSMSFAVWFGLFTGVLYLLCLRAVEKSVREKGAGVTTLYQRLGILVPILCSALLWGEVPSPVQLAGLAASVAVMAALGAAADSGGRVGLSPRALPPGKAGPRPGRPVPRAGEPVNKWICARSQNPVK